MQHRDDVTALPIAGPYGSALRDQPLLLTEVGGESGYTGSLTDLMPSRI
jgi:hypothetical protein